MAGSTSSSEGFLEDLLTPILPNIRVEPTREGIINLHRLVSGNVVSVVSTIEGGRHEHLTLTMTSVEYKTQKLFTFVPPHNPSN